MERNDVYIFKFSVYLVEKKFSDRVYWLIQTKKRKFLLGISSFSS